jgi:hypothetical protein
MKPLLRCDCAALPSSSAAFRLGSQLNLVRLYDGREQTGKAFLNFGAAGDVLHLDPAPLAPNQTGVA